MPGFGSGPFGHEPFGEWKWSRRVLYEHIPEIYRQQDEAVGGLLETYSEALRPSFDELRRQIRLMEDLRDPLRVRTKFDDVRKFQLGPRVQLQGLLEQRGIDARVDGLNQFIAPKGRFNNDSVGKELIVSGSQFPSNNKSTTITSVVNSTTIVTADVLSTDVGPLVWEMRTAVTEDDTVVTVQVKSGDVSAVKPGWALSDGRADFTVVARRQFPTLDSDPLSLTHNEGTDGTINGSGNFVSATAALDMDDVGRPIVISTSAIPDNNNKWEITDVLSASEAVISNADGDTPTIDTTSFSWAIFHYPEIDLFGQIEPTGTVELSGLQGEVIGVNTFKTQSGQFTDTDIGKLITLRGCANIANNVITTITAVNGEEVTVSDTLVTPDTGLFAPPSIAWEMRTPTALLGTAASGTLVGSASVLDAETVTIGTKTYTFQLLLTNVDGNVLIGASVAESLANLKAAINLDAGAGVTYAAATTPNIFVTAENTTTTVVVTAKVVGEGGNSIATTETATNLLWGATTLLGGTGEKTVEVTMRASSMIERLAKDFGIEIDNQESEDRQRSWIKNVSRWVQQKGTPKAYEILGAISGFDVTVSQLYRISIEIASSLPEVLEIGESPSYRSGTDGTLTEVGLNVRFSSPTAVFTVGDEGTHIRVRDADTAGNNALYTIESFIDANTVEMRVADTVALPEANNGSLTWAVVRLYADNPPALPNFDEIDDDFMEALIDGYEPQSTNKFGIDKYCWEDDFFADVEIAITSTAQVAPGVFDVTTSDGPAQGPSGVIGTAGVVQAVRNWSLIDSLGREFFVETTPVASGADFVFQVKAALNPAVGAATLRYNCPVTLTCDYCGSSRVLATIVADTILNEEGVAVERALDRVILRLEDVVPAHVLLVPRFSQTIECTLNLTMNTDVRSIDTVMYMPKDVYFDDVQADVLVADPTGASSDIHTSDVGQADHPYTGLVLRCNVERTI